jgi:hypothetical protein
MRRDLLHAVALIALLLMLGGQVSEMFDHWDDTLRTGRDLDYPVVVIAACGAIVFLGRAAIRLFSRALSALAPKHVFESLTVRSFVPPATSPTSSPPALRI